MNYKEDKKQVIRNLKIIFPKARFKFYEDIIINDNLFWKIACTFRLDELNLIKYHLTRFSNEHLEFTYYIAKALIEDYKIQNYNKYAYNELLKCMQDFGVI